jgi:hypothetical protein
MIIIGPSRALSISKFTVILKTSSNTMANGPRSLTFRPLLISAQNLPSVILVIPSRSSF